MVCISKVQNEVEEKSKGLTTHYCVLGYFSFSRLQNPLESSISISGSLFLRHDVTTSQPQHQLADIVQPPILTLDDILGSSFLSAPGGHCIETVILVLNFCPIAVNADSALRSFHAEPVHVQPQPRVHDTALCRPPSRSCLLSSQFTVPFLRNGYTQH